MKAGSSNTPKPPDTNPPSRVLCERSLGSFFQHFAVDLSFLLAVFQIFAFAFVLHPCK